MAAPTTKKSRALPIIKWRTYKCIIAGTDEVGRGCLAGPVYAAAVILDPKIKWTGLTDSKLIDHEARVAFAEKIKSNAVSWSIGTASVEEIEKINILHASLLAMKRAVEGLHVRPDVVLIDGNQKIKGPWTQETHVKGDLRCQPISAAGIIAKVTRDAFMDEQEIQFPGYGFGQNKGYGTPYHQKAIATLGVTNIHRRLFRGVKEFWNLDENGSRP